MHLLNVSGRVAAVLAALAAAAALGQRVVSSDARTAGGYTFVAPIHTSSSYLIDGAGRVVRQWDGQGPPGLVVHLLPNGHLLRTGTVASNVFASSGASGGRVDEFAPDGSLVWTFTLATERLFRHHDIAPMPNGNILMIAWEAKTRAEAIAAGRDPAQISGDMFWSEAVFEIRPVRPSGGEVVWEWHVWDHLVQDFDAARPNYGDPAAHLERMDINYGPQSPDWLHFNAVAYNPELDQIALSSRTLSEIWVIDHSTTAAEAAERTGGRQGKGGDLLYRWGNPQVYRAGTDADQRLFDQHNVQWIAPGLPGARETCWCSATGARGTTRRWRRSCRR